MVHFFTSDTILVRLEIEGLMDLSLGSKECELVRVFCLVFTATRIEGKGNLHLYGQIVK